MRQPGSALPYLVYLGLHIPLSIIWLIGILGGGAISCNGGWHLMTNLREFWPLWLAIPCAILAGIVLFSVIVGLIILPLHAIWSVIIMIAEHVVKKTTQPTEPWPTNPAPTPDDQQTVFTIPRESPYLPKIVKRGKVMKPSFRAPDMPDEESYEPPTKLDAKRIEDLEKKSSK